MVGKRDVSVGIIGGGFGGIITAIKLKQAGFSDFTIFEKGNGPGGTWWSNTYPGCEVDVGSQYYSLSFCRYDWKRTHATQPELLEYVYKIIEHYDIYGHFRFSTRVESAEWDESRSEYLVKLETGEAARFDVVVSAVGLLSNPRIPDWLGLDSFAGSAFHTAEWQHQHDLHGKRIAFVGTGSTGAQVVPALAKIAGHVDVYQRQPGWVLPKPVRDYTAWERKLHSIFLIQKLARYREFRAVQKAVTFKTGSKANEQAAQSALEYLNETVTDPALRAALTPDYAFGCKRPVLSSDFYPALVRENVTLVPHAVDHVTTTGIVAADGVERDADVVIIGTGFQAQDYLPNLEIRGVGGISLHGYWGDEPRAVAGVMVPNFPNFFIMYGPNTNGGAIMFQLERSAGVAVRAAKRLRRTGARAVVTDQAALTKYVKWIDRRIDALNDAVWSGCTNYYNAPSGRNVVTWPGHQLVFALVSRFVPEASSGLVYDSENRAKHPC